MKKKMFFLESYDASFPNLVYQTVSLIEFPLGCQSNEG